MKPTEADDAGTVDQVDVSMHFLSSHSIQSTQQVDLLEDVEFTHSELPGPSLENDLRRTTSASRDDNMTYQGASATVPSDMNEASGEEEEENEDTLGLFSDASSSPSHHCLSSCSDYPSVSHSYHSSHPSNTTSSSTSSDFFFDPVLSECSESFSSSSSSQFVASQKPDEITYSPYHTNHSRSRSLAAHSHYPLLNPMDITYDEDYLKLCHFNMPSSPMIPRTGHERNEFDDDLVFSDEDEQLIFNEDEDKRFSYSEDHFCQDEHFNSTDLLQKENPLIVDMCDQSDIFSENEDVDMKEDFISEKDDIENIFQRDYEMLESLYHLSLVDEDFVHLQHVLYLINAEISAYRQAIQNPLTQASFRSDESADHADSTLDGTVDGYPVKKRMHWVAVVSIPRNYLQESIQLARLSFFGDHRPEDEVAEINEEVFRRNDEKDYSLQHFLSILSDLLTTYSVPDPVMYRDNIALFVRDFAFPLESRRHWKEIHEGDVEGREADAVESTGKLKAIALYSFEPETAGEMALREGQIVCVVERGIDGWMLVFKPAQPDVTGYVPENYMRLLNG